MQSQNQLFFYFMVHYLFVAYSVLLERESPQKVEQN